MTKFFKSGIRCGLVVVILLFICMISNNMACAKEKSKSEEEVSKSDNSVIVGPWEFSVLSFKTSKMFYAKRGINEYSFEANDQNVIAQITVSLKPVRKYTPDEKTNFFKSKGFLERILGKEADNNLCLSLSSFTLLSVEKKADKPKLVMSTCSYLGGGSFTVNFGSGQFSCIELDKDSVKYNEYTLVFEYNPAWPKPVLCFMPISAEGKQQYALIQTQDSGKISVEFLKPNELRKYYPKELWDDSK